MKANTKWVEYTCVGAAVLATRGLVYDGCCDDGSGMLLADDEWLDALEMLTDDPDARYEMVCRAQEKVETVYSVENLQAQVLSIFAEARRARDEANAAPWPHVLSGTLAAIAGRELKMLLA
ncbi:glycosyltransferase [Aestuariivirga sp.]|uniref:glycosyltransferase n=1 Tax=Aestuariivirga sp. TaxID=2650926 RepID=UPI0035935B67